MISIRRRLKVARQIHCTDRDLTHAIRVCVLAGVVTTEEGQRAAASLRDENVGVAK